MAEVRSIPEDRHAGWRLLWWATRSQGHGVPAIIISGVVWMVAAAATPLVIARAIDEGVVAGDWQALLLWISALVGLGLVEAGAGIVRHYYAVRNGESAAARIRERLLAHFLHMDAAFYNRWPSGQLLSHSESDANRVGFFTDYIGHTSGFVAAVIVVSIFLFLTDPFLAAVALCSLPVISALVWYFGRRYRKLSHELQEELAGATVVAEDTISGIRVVTGLRAEEAQKVRFVDRARRVREKGLAVARLDATFEPLTDAMPTLGLLAVLWVGGYFAVSGRISVGELVAFYAYVVLLIDPLRIIGERIGTIQRSLASAERISKLLDIEPEVDEPENPRPLPPIGDGTWRGKVHFEGVRFAYGEYEPPVFEGLDLWVEAGSKVALVGATGSGKSTVAELLSRRYDPQAGRVVLDGVDLRDLSFDVLRRAVLVVSDQPVLFADTVRANIALARPEASPAEVERAAQLAEAHGFIEQLPQGYETVIRERGLSLSGGQRQRISLARAILADPRVLVLDDAISAVDATTEAGIRRGLKEALAGRTTIIVSRRPATIALADRVVVLDRGRVVAEGTHEELFATDESYRRLLIGAGVTI